MTDTTFPLKQGDRFHHRRLLDASKLPRQVPQLCIVTAVRKGVIYYRPDYGIQDGRPSYGSSSYFPIEEIHRWASPL